MQVRVIQNDGGIQQESSNEFKVVAAGEVKW